MQTGRDKDGAAVGSTQRARDGAMTALDRRALLGGGAALAGLMVLGGCGKALGGGGGGGGGGDPVLRASIIGKGEADTALLLRTAGLAPQGYRVEYSNFPSGQLVIEALNGGSLDYGGMSEIPPIFAAASTHQSFKQIAIYHGDVNNQVVLIPKGSTARSFADLKGKRVGYVRATTSQYFLIRMLEQVGLGWGDIQPIAMGVSDGAAAFSRGALDAWAIYGFPIQRAVATEGARILKTAYGILSGNYMVVAHVDALADPAKSKAIGDYLQLVSKGYAWGAAHADQWAQVVSNEIGVPLAYVQDEFKRRSDTYSLRPITPEAIASQQAVADVFAKAGLIPGPVDVRPLWDDRFNSIIRKA